MLRIQLFALFTAVSLSACDPSNNELAFGDDPDTTPDDTEPDDTDTEPDDTDDPGDTDDPDDVPGCEEVVLDIKGPVPAYVGDEWVIIMRCDGALMQGATVIRFDPPDFALTSDKTVTFTRAGEASMRVQIGAYRLDQMIEVLR